MNKSEHSIDYWGSKQQPFWRPGANPTVDILVIKDHKEILLIKRTLLSDACPGMYALPGGFHDTESKKGEAWMPGKETAKEAAIRELKEETGLEIENINDLVEIGIYEGGNRDPRDNKEAWSKSTVFAINLKEVLHQIQGQDDASEAIWVPICEALEMELAFDHHIILMDGLKIMKTAKY